MSHWECIQVMVMGGGDGTHEDGEVGEEVMVIRAVRGRRE